MTGTPPGVPLARGAGLTTDGVDLYATQARQEGVLALQRGRQHLDDADSVRR